MHNNTKIEHANSLISISGNALSGLVVLAVAGLGGMIVKADPEQGIATLLEDPYYIPLMILMAIALLVLSFVRDYGLKLLDKIHQENSKGGG